MTEEQLADMAAAVNLPDSLEVDEFWEFCLAGNDVQPWLHVPCTVETLRSMPAEARERMGYALRAAAAAPRLAAEVRRLRAELAERDDLLSHATAFEWVNERGYFTQAFQAAPAQDSQWIVHGCPDGGTYMESERYATQAKAVARARELVGEGGQ